MSDTFENYTAAYRRIMIEARLIRAGNDVCLLVTGGEVKHIGAIGCAAGGKTLFSQNLPGHREQALTDIFLRELAPAFKGTLLVSTGVHLNAITPDEIQNVLDLGSALAKRIARESQFLNEHHREKE